MILNYCSLIAMLLLIWFRTEAFIEYCKLFHITNISFYEDYELKKAEDARLTYLTYLRQYHNNFFTRMITCPICLSFWISVIICVFNITLIPISMMGGLLIFIIIDKLLG